MRNRSVYIGSRGICNKTDTYSKYDPESGVPFMLACSNVTVTNDGTVKRRAGYAKILDGADNLFEYQGYVLYSKQGNLYRLDVETHISDILGYVGFGKIHYYEDKTDRVFIISVEGKYVLKDNILDVWGRCSRNSTFGDNREFSSVPALATKTFGFKGYYGVVVDDYLFFSEPFDPYTWVYDEGNINCGTAIRMVLEVDHGLYVSNQNEIIFFSGNTPEELTPKVVWKRPAVDGTAQPVTQNEINDTLVSAQGYVVTTADAVILLSADGNAYELSQHIEIPEGKTGSSMVIDGLYIVNIREI